MKTNSKVLNLSFCVAVLSSLALAGCAGGSGGNSTSAVQAATQTTLPDGTVAWTSPVCGNPIETDRVPSISTSSFPANWSKLHLQTMRYYFRNLKTNETFVVSSNGAQSPEVSLDCNGMIKNQKFPRILQAEFSMPKWIILNDRSSVYEREMAVRWVNGNFEGGKNSEELSVIGPRAIHTAECMHDRLVSGRIGSGQTFSTARMIALGSDGYELRFKNEYTDPVTGEGIVEFESAIYTYAK